MVPNSCMSHTYSGPCLAILEVRVWEKSSHRGAGTQLERVSLTLPSCSQRPDPVLRDDGVSTVVSIDGVQQGRLSGGI